MSCQTLPCWSANAELSGDRRKEVNVSIVIMRTGKEVEVGFGLRARGGEEERDEVDGVWIVSGVLDSGGELVVLSVLDSRVGEEGTLFSADTTEYLSKISRSSSCDRLD